MPATHTSVRIPINEAAVLGDLYGVETDLEFVTRICRSAISLAKVPSQDSDVVESLVCAALVRYFRCFSMSPRLGLRHEEIGRRSKSIREAHAWFRWLRDRFVAHSINPLEHVWASLTFTVRDGMPEPVSHINSGSLRLLLGAREAETISLLAEHALAVVRRKIKPEQKRLLKVIQKLPLNTIKSWVERPHPRVHPQDVSLVRSQTRPNPAMHTNLAQKAARGR